MTEFPGSPLGNQSGYPDKYDPSLLYAIPRAGNRGLLRLASGSLPFIGADIWTAYEMSWLNSDGLPQVAIGRIVVNCGSPNIVESKSFKLYLNSLNQNRFANWQMLEELLIDDLSACIGKKVDVTLYAPAEFAAFHRIAEPDGICIDGLPVVVGQYSPQPELLRADNQVSVSEMLYSHLFRSRCPVTGQPDWASICIDYSGPKIDRGRLLRYLVSYREHRDFHENCVEKIFVDLCDRVQPIALDVYARFTRRGGLDINPFRSTRFNLPPDNSRHVRQ